MENLVISHRLILLLCLISSTMVYSVPVVADEAICSSSGDPHYKTFGGEKFNFMGKCRYALVLDRSINVMVIQTNKICRENYTCVAAVQVRSKQGGIVTIEDVPEGSPPLVVQDYTVIFKKNGVEVKTSIAQVNNHSVGGLCGSPDNDPKNDFKLPSGAITAKAMDFGNAWSVGEGCTAGPFHCAAGLCSNGGTCTNQLTLAGYACACKTGWTGPTCSEVKDMCKPSPCKNGADCYAEGNDFYCDCTAGYTGRFCESPGLL